MKRLTFLLAASCFLITLQVKAQEAEAEKKPLVEVSGYVQWTMYTDTYKNVEAREGLLNLYPVAAYPDANGKDINEGFRFNMAEYNSRARIKFNGPNVGNAKVSGLFEADFLGTTASYVRLLRIRHAMVKLDWEKSNLIVGQYWHPVWRTNCFPKTLSFGAGVPFHTLNRSPQIRFTQNLSSGFLVELGAVMQGYHKSKGPEEAQRNSGVPEFTIHPEFSNGTILIGATAGYKVFKPRMITSMDTLKTDKTIGSFVLVGHLGFKTGPIDFRGEVIYGQNLTHLVMIGGYGAKDNPSVVDDYDYTNLTTLALWGDLGIKAGPVDLGLFGGYSSNMGASDTFYDLSTPSLSYTRSANLSHIYRVSPRVSKTINKFMFGFEYQLTGAVYGTDFNEKGKVTESADAVVNHRFLVTTQYSF